MYLFLVGKIKFGDTEKWWTSYSCDSRLHHRCDKQWTKISRIELNLTNRFHVAVRLFSSRSQRTSKCSKNKKVAHNAMSLNIAVVTAVWSWVPAVAESTGHLSYTSIFSLYSSTCVLVTCLEIILDILIYLCFYRSLSSHAERCFPWPESYHPATRLYPGWERCEYQNWSASPCHCKGQLVGQPVGHW